MKRLLASCCLLPAFFAGLPAGVAADPPAAVVERGKAATALIVGHNDKPVGAAFCVDPTGVFVTNLLLTLDENVDLALRPGPKGEARVRARVVYATKNPWW